MQKLPRGVRNNNPGNIDYNPKNKWVGQVGIEDDVDHPRFAKFDTATNGIRAIAKLILGYHKRGYNTVTRIINRWAPPKENDTGAYVENVADCLGVAANDVLPVLTLDSLSRIVGAIIYHENGYSPYNLATVVDACKEALK